jgi:transposase InsO family protein
MAPFGAGPSTRAPTGMAHLPNRLGRQAMIATGSATLANVWINAFADAVAAFTLIDSWMEDYNTVHPHSRLGYRSRREYIMSQPVACPV